MLAWCQGVLADFIPTATDGWGIPLSFVKGDRQWLAKSAVLEGIEKGDRYRYRILPYSS